MNKVIWTYFPDGRDAAPVPVQKCLRSWELKNPGWEVRCLDSATAERYLTIKQYLSPHTISPKSLSMILRLLLLHEFGGVWVDPNLFCAKPLDDWLPKMMAEGFFALEDSSRFIAAEEFNPIISKCCRDIIEYWNDWNASEHDSWLEQLIKTSFPKQATPVLPSNEEVLIDLEWMPEPMLDELPNETQTKAETMTNRPASFASLKVSTENIGDHIQIVAGLRILSRMGIKPIHYIDRDHEIQSAPQLAKVTEPVGILLNGWFKSNRAEWPPHPKLVPVMMGFHIRTFQCPELLMEPSIDFFRKHEPIGCRDIYTQGLLKEKGVDGFVSNCLTLTMNRRIDDPAQQTETFVVSRDRKIESFLPDFMRPYTFVSHYSGTHDFLANMKVAKAILEEYRSRAKLIITTLLHCALPAIAMGIPVIVIYPPNDEKGHQSDRERFSSLEKLVRIYHLAEMDQVNWTPERVPVGEVKLDIFDRFYELAKVWG